ncbi:hypothetical protein A9Q89_03380 [Gammaproteobacteria bacterium 53_120_T64]|nr:hypothetical protein A9Q89_03380 [Gammaproteobacteria bacterium 53_120_T64]
MYARWPGVKQHNSSAQYTISHNGQTVLSNQDQSKTGNQWVLLGTYAFSGASDEYIELSDVGGKTAADAIRLVEITSAPPPTLTASVYYSHNDHLGTPQVFTDQNQNVAWRGDYRPFGEVSESVTTLANNLRFPGQYFDGETGLHYNYFRDYDAGTGRYVQSDPIGLGGGLNTYGYVGGNPLKWDDLFGLAYGLGSGLYSQSNVVKRSTIKSGVPNRSIGEVFGKTCLEICYIDTVYVSGLTDIAVALIPAQVKVAPLIAKSLYGVNSVVGTSLSLSDCVMKCEDSECSVE